MSGFEQTAPRLAARGASHEEASQPASAPANWLYTLAHAETPLRDLALGEEDLRVVVEALRARNVPLPAELAAPPARRARGPLAGARYIWAFSSLRDALQVARLNRRSDYHAYPQPSSLREASLDRLFRRFPLTEFPRASVILFSGTRICLDPLLAADPLPGSLAADLAEALGPTLWERFTLLGLRQGASLARVTPADRWVRLRPRTLEDAWEVAERNLRALAASERAEDTEAPQPELGDMETLAFQALLCAVTGAPIPEPPAAAPLPAQRPRRARRRGAARQAISHR
ncbi:MAG TPA: hypothetical protein VF808_18525 [Ktedonobacterales bacterium]